MRLQGGEAFFSFQYQVVLDKLKKITPETGIFKVYWVYAIQLQRPLDGEEEAQLKALLGAVEAPSLPKMHRFWVVPRGGMQSPWSSKATELAKRCGLKAVLSIERWMECWCDSREVQKALAPLVSDRMLHTILWEETALEKYLEHQPQAEPLRYISVRDKGMDALMEANSNLGLALSTPELEYLYQLFLRLQRDPTDAELMMFAQANSEHCRHKIFNAHWTIDGVEKTQSLFAMIKNTYTHSSKGVLSAYRDNAAVFENKKAKQLKPDLKDHHYQWQTETVGTLIKVETHNHPTAISPYPGAATGSGGEIRDEGAVGRGGKPKAGLVGFSVSDLQLKEWPQSWEVPLGKPAHISSSVEIMVEAPLGSAAYGNEFGRPTLCGYFRTFTQKITEHLFRGYHKPIMIAGGMGNIEVSQVTKGALPEGALLIVLGGPAFSIGLGGGSASSQAQGQSESALDFASVQRDNPEMERRCQEVIDRCAQLKEHNPILSIHDVGAGGLSNALTELVHDAGKGALLDLRAIPCADPSLSPMAVWCNEAQERYVLGILEQDLERFSAIAKRERAPFAIVGRVQAQERLCLVDPIGSSPVVDLDIKDILSNLPKQCRTAKTKVRHFPEIIHAHSLSEIIRRLLSLPVIASKSFLITIADRSVTGLVARDQMIGPWQVPVSDVAVTSLDYEQYHGEAMAMGERAPVALWDPIASVQLAIGEAITNIMAADIQELSSIRLSCNWMAASGFEEDDADLFAAVEEVGMHLCPALKICVPVGKDSLSMKSIWKESEKNYTVAAPLSLVVSAFAPVEDVRRTLTPLLDLTTESVLLLIDLGPQQKSLGGSCYAQVTQQMAGTAPRLEEPALLERCFKAIRALAREGLLLAYHDRSEGGVFITLLEMAFAAHTGLDIFFSSEDIFETLFNEALGVVIQIKSCDLDRVNAVLASHSLAEKTTPIAKPNQTQAITLYHQDQKIYSEQRKVLYQLWSRTSYEIQKRRDNPSTAKEAYEALLEDEDPGLSFYSTKTNIVPPMISQRGELPRVGILREQGVNGHLEMAAAFSLAGFRALDLTMSDLLADPGLLHSLQGVAACGGFSYGDVLGAGTGWAKGILFHEPLRAAFQAFFERKDTFTLGVCNGCQMLVQLKTLIPGAEHWPALTPNLSGRFEARLSLVEIMPSPSLFFKGMEGSRLPLAVSHGEGRVVLNDKRSEPVFPVCLRYIDNYGAVAHAYPSNPNGSDKGITGFCSQDGRVTALMPHPERVFRRVQLSWCPSTWQEEYSPWMQLFINAREWVNS